jgi:hypothetical protein
VVQSDNELAKSAEVSGKQHLAEALVTLEAAAAALHVRAEAAEKRADAAEGNRQAAQTRVDDIAAERDEANRRANEFKMLLDAAQLELAGLRTLIDVAPHAAIQAEADRQGRSARPRPERPSGGRRGLIWVIRILVSAAAAAALWFVAPLLRFDALQALLCLVVFVSVMLGLVLVSWRRSAGRGE